MTCSNAVAIATAATHAEHAATAVDAMAYQVCDVLEAMAADAGGPVTTVRADGGAARNDSLLQLQADLVIAQV